MSFDLYFACSMPPSVDEYIQRAGYDLMLLSYATERSTIKKRAEQGRKTFVDCGAYTAKTKGITINIDEYIDFVNAYAEHICLFAQLDVIPVPGITNSAQLTWENYLYMRERVKDVSKLLPVYHRGTPLEYLHKILSFEPKIEYMAFGALVGASTNERDTWIDEVFEVIKASPNPNIKVHAFGMTNFNILSKHPVYSADSASWVISAGNGAIFCDYGYIAISPGKHHLKEHLIHKPEQFKEKFVKMVESTGFDFTELCNSRDLRILWNVKYFVGWARNYKRLEKTIKQNKLF